MSRTNKISLILGALTLLGVAACSSDKSNPDGGDA